MTQKIRYLGAAGLVAAALVVGSACSSSSAEPAQCNGNGSENYAQACGALQTAVASICAGSSLDCMKAFISPCNDTSKSFCTDGVNAYAKALGAAPDCATAIAMAPPQPVYCF